MEIWGKRRRFNLHKIGVPKRDNRGNICNRLLNPEEKYEIQEAMMSKNKNVK